MSESEQNSSNSCSMVGFLGIIIQLGLGVLSFSVLIIKRFRQYPRRPWKIWLFDTSKQLVSQMMAHFINLTISIALASSDSSSDECLWYFITNVLDNTLGVFICLVCLMGIEKNLVYRKKFEYVSGNYYVKERVKIEVELQMAKGDMKESVEQKESNVNELDEANGDSKRNDELVEERQHDIEQDSRVSTIGSRHPQSQADKHAHYLQKYKINYKSWLVQLLIWMSIVIIGKTVIFGLQIGLEQPLKFFSFLILGWIQSYPIFQLMLVIIIVPVIMNGLAFWIQDNFLKKKEQAVPEGENPLIQEAPHQVNAL